MSHTTLGTILTLALALGVGANSAHAIVLGQIDDFQDGTTQGWISGGSNPNPPVNVADLGPLGVGDHVLQATGNGGGGAGGKLVIFNQAQWLGDYNAANVTAIRFDANNVGTENVSLGFSMNGGSAITFDTGTIAPGSGWNTYEIPLDSLVFGSTTNLDNVTDIRLLYVQGGTFISGVPVEVHLDNITAIPEPATVTLAALLGLGGLAIARRRRQF